MLRKLYYLLSLSYVTVSLSGCENPSYVYEGASVLEFKNPRAGFATQPANNVSNAIRTRTVRQGIGRDSILVQLVGPQRSTPTSVAYTLDPTNTASEATNFVIIGTRGTVTIPANSNTGYLVVQFLPAIPSTAPTTLTVRLAITLTGAEGILPSENYKTFTYTIRN
jgi:hypothetical protein